MTVNEHFQNVSHNTDVYSIYISDLFVYVIVTINSATQFLSHNMFKL